MKTKLADLGLGFVGFLLVVQVLWLSYSYATTLNAPPFLWEQAVSTLALSVGFVFLWRATSPQQQLTPRHSLVLLLRSPRNVTSELLVPVVKEALGVNLEQKDLQTSHSISDASSTFRIHAGKYTFRVNNSVGPYIDRTENTSENIPNVRLQQVVREHVAWLSVDLLEAPQDASSNDIYQRLGRIIAALADSDCVGLCCPETNQLNVWHPNLITHLQSSTPLQAVAELSEVPAIRVTTNNADMEEAALKANSMWSVFVNAFEQQRPGQTFAVKAPFTDGQET